MNRRLGQLLLVVAVAPTSVACGAAGATPSSAEDQLPPVAAEASGGQAASGQSEVLGTEATVKLDLPTTEPTKQRPSVTLRDGCVSRGARVEVPTSHRASEYTEAWLEVADDGGTFLFVSDGPVMLGGACTNAFGGRSVSTVSPPSGVAWCWRSPAPRISRPEASGSRFRGTCRAPKPVWLRCG